MSNTKYPISLEKSNLIIKELNEIVIYSPWDLSDVCSQYAKNSPTNFSKWRESLLREIRTSCSLGFNSGVLAHKWMRRFAQGNRGITEKC